MRRKDNFFNGIKNKRIQNQEFKIFLETGCQHLKYALHEFEDILKYMKTPDFSPLKPDPKTAFALLEYMETKDPQVAKIIKMLLGIEFQRYIDWINIYCKEHKCSKEYVLKLIIKSVE